MRKKYKAFGRGSIEFLHPENYKILAFIRRYQEEIILVVVNLSRFSQVAELDLAQYAGYHPIEVFSKNQFPLIRETPYILTMGFHDYFWFSLQKEDNSVTTKKREQIPVLSSQTNWLNLFKGKTAQLLEGSIIPSFLTEQRWFGKKSQRIRKVNITEKILLKNANSTSLLVFLKIGYDEGLEEYYLLPLSYLEKEKAEYLQREMPQSVLLKVHSDNQDGIVCDAVYDTAFHQTLIQLITGRRIIIGKQGKIRAYSGKYFRKLRRKAMTFENSRLMGVEQSNSSIIYEKDIVLKLFRKLDEGVNPDLEVGKYLTEETNFTNIPAFCGAIEFQQNDHSMITLGILYPFIQSVGNAWTYSQDALGRYYERALSKIGELDKIPPLPASLFDKLEQDIPGIFQELIDTPYIEMIGLLGKRTAELHLALAQPSENPDFQPESFSTLYQRALYQSIQASVKRTFQDLRKNARQLPEDLQNDLTQILTSESRILQYCKILLSSKIRGMKTRIHGDYHLGQVLYTGNDFYIIDFEGEPARLLGERRLKRCPLKDVAGMLRSFHYAAFAPLIQQHIPGDYKMLETWAKFWTYYISKIFLKSYLEHTKEASFLPEKKEQLPQLLKIYLLEKAVYEIGYEMNHRPNWLLIPFKGILYELGEVNEEK
jgi:maltose alpha-D-glucosyltransferase/alpha-amylase